MTQNETQKPVAKQLVAVAHRTSVVVQVSQGLLLGFAVVLFSSFFFAGLLAGFTSRLVETGGGEDGGGMPLTGNWTWYRSQTSNPTSWPFLQNSNNLALWSDVNQNFTYCVDSIGDNGVYQSITTGKGGICGLNSVESNPRVPIALMEHMNFSISGNICYGCGGLAPGNGYNFTTQWSKNWITGWNSAGCAINETTFPTVCSTGVGFTIQALFDDESPWRFRGYRFHTFDHGEGTLHVRLTSQAEIGEAPPPPPPGGGGSPAVLKASPEYINAWLCEFFGDCDNN